MKTVTLILTSGIVILESCPDNVKVILRDYDIQEIENDNPDREYGNDEFGDYEISEL